MFEVVQGERGRVKDIQTGIELVLRQTQDYAQVVAVKVPARGTFSFSVQVEAKYPEKPFTAGDKSNPTILILMGSIKAAADFFDGSIEENTRFVKLILNGLSTINRIWPLSRSPFFYSDREKYIGRESMFPFILPSEEEINGL